MSRMILLIEPGYKNKYPPIGLMKIATYHRRMGDQVVFYKGDLKKFMIGRVADKCIRTLQQNFPGTDWQKRKRLIEAYIPSRRKVHMHKILELCALEERPFVEDWVSHFSFYYRRKEWVKEAEWDRIYVTTLFTFYWKITVKAIHFAKQLVRSEKDLWIGGVMASLLPDEIEAETGIKPFKGLLNRPGILDEGNKDIIDELPLDYSILNETEYVYPTQSSYFTFMTKGCTRSCAFCAVPKIETSYQEKVPTIDKFMWVKEKYGEQQHLLLMDNNVLASPKFPQIIQEIKDMGFVRGAKFIEPNQLDIAVRNLASGENDSGYTQRCYSLIQQFLSKRLRNKEAEAFYALLEEYELLDKELVTKEKVLKLYPRIKQLYENRRDKRKKSRFVDFNQGTDARYVTDENMSLMAQIPIYPLRIAFDFIGLKKKYINAVRLAAKHDIRRLSNYLLYNFKDRPEDLYKRMKINVELSEDLDVHIYSFPMKYIPLFGEEAKHRKYIGKFWNRKYIRAVQSILNATKGIVAPKRSFFEMAFGYDLEEFMEILLMPETYIIYRNSFKDLGYTKMWREDLERLTQSEETIAMAVILSNDFKNIELPSFPYRVQKLLRHYSITRSDVKADPTELSPVVTKFNKLIKEDMFVDLTLTYDFERRRV